MRAALPGDTLPVLCCKFGQVQVHVALSNQHICKKNKKKQEPPPSPNRYFPISIERLPLSRLSRFFFRIKVSPSCAATGTGLNGFKMREWLCVFVTRFSQVPGLTLFCLALLPEPPSSSLPVLHLPGRPARFQMHRSHCRGLQTVCWLPQGPKAYHLNAYSEQRGWGGGVKVI